MLKGAKVLILLLLLSWTNSFTQELSHQVLVPLAGQSVSGVINYSQTVGETAPEMITSSGFIFTQGFQQPGITISTEPPHEGTGVEVYPNPARDFINIKMFGDVARKFTIEIINITGTIVSTMTLDFITSYFYIKQIDVTGFKTGFYFVRVASNDSNINRVFKIEKM